MVNQLDSDNFYRSFKGFLKRYLTDKAFFEENQNLNLKVVASADWPPDLMKIYLDEIKDRKWMSFDEFIILFNRKHSNHKMYEIWSQNLESIRNMIQDDKIKPFSGNLSLYQESLVLYTRKQVLKMLATHLKQKSEESTLDDSDILTILSESDSGVRGLLGLRSKESDNVNFRDIDKIKKIIEENYSNTINSHNFTLGLFEDHMPALKGGDFVCVWAEAKRGKSTYKREVAMRNIRRGLNGIYISTEMLPRQNILLFTSLIKGCKKDDLWSGKIVEKNDEYQDLILDYQDFFNKYPDSFFEFVQTNNELSDVQNKILYYKNKCEEAGKKLDYVILDHILDLRINGKSVKSNTEVLTEIVVSMYDFGVVNDYITLTSQHVKRDGIKYKNGKPYMPPDAGFGTSAMEKKATLIIGFTQAEQQKYAKQITAQIPYSRFGNSTVQATFTTDLELQRFVASNVTYREFDIMNFG